jgi:predicted DNA-binding transcriptional regulator AlpA
MPTTVPPTGHDQSPDDDVPRWLSVREIAADLSVSMHTVYKWSAKGEPWFPKTIRLRNGDLRVRRDWYEAWLKHLEAPGA